MAPRLVARAVSSARAHRGADAHTGARTSYRYCYHHKTHCSLCHYSPSSLYYINYYSTYYSDYYSDYYADYYSQAVDKMDLSLHPPGHWHAGGYAASPQWRDALQDNI